MKYIFINNLYIVLKITIIIVAILILFLTTQFWIGTETNWNDVLKHEFYPALLTRSIFSVIIGLLFLCFSTLLDRAFKKEGSFSKELMILIIFSLTLNLVVLLTAAKNNDQEIFHEYLYLTKSY
ncbi:hypothetical protein [Chryseobacterium chendengshani]|uniref:hypothetical protein n=1 Tax=Chryseobacterium sp. LJ756 TaxID=2864113 RepID=UPI001C643794|nr:hypothetical protein [Chryseobacterium sp. LJ756]MBW7674226.1 hypothetical protein [Chryseobacterium sp. LJ756]